MAKIKHIRKTRLQKNPFWLYYPNPQFPKKFKAATLANPHCYRQRKKLMLTLLYRILAKKSPYKVRVHPMHKAVSPHKTIWTIGEG